MTLSPWLGVAFTVVGACVPVMAHAAVDEVQLRLVRQFEMPLRWDNVESAPAWVAGAAPQYQRHLGYHTVRLVPGAQVTLRVPGNERVRFVHPDSPLDPNALQVEASQGSGLYASLPVVQSSDSRSLLTHVIADAPLLVRVSRPAASGEAIEIGLFVSRREPFGTLAPYREVLPLAVPTVRMQREDAPGRQRFWILTPDTPAHLMLDGPQRLAFEHRPTYAAGEAALRQSYRVGLQLDGVPWRSLEFDTLAESVYPVELNGEMQAMGRRQMSYLELPPGKHQLTLEANAKLYGRLLGQAEPDYLFAGLNAPARTASEVRQALLPFPLAATAPLLPDARKALPVLKLSPWLSTDDEIRRAVTARDVTPSEQEAIALRLARDNTRREGGLQAGMLMREAAEANRDVPEVQHAAAAFMGHASFYRNLLPAIKLGAAPQRFAFFSNRRIHRYGEQLRGETAALAQRDAWLDRLDQAYFLDAPIKLDALPSVEQISAMEQRLILPSDVLFATDRADLRPDYETSLSAWLDSVVGREVRQIRVIGHTDDRASARYNEGLSRRRAEVVAGLLLRLGMAAERLQVEAKGETMPRASNATAVGRQRNRRVEVVLRYASPNEARASAAPTGQVYWLPERSEPTLLRVIADMERSSPGARFYVQLDDAAPTLFQVAQFDELPAEAYAPDDGSTGLAMLARQHGIADAGSLGGPFASGPRTPARLIRAAAFELPVARGVRRVGVWREGAAPVYLALQYRASKPFALNETALLAELRSLPAEGEAFAVLKAAVQAPPAPDAARPTRELANHWQALVRYIQTQRRVLAQNVIPATLHAEPGERSDAVAQHAIQAARAAERDGQWLLALEHWSMAYRRGEADSRWLAALGRVGALQQLGEGYLAEQQLKSILLSKSPAASRQAAQARLVARYQAADDHDAQATLWAGLFAAGGTPDHLTRLVDHLLALDNLDLALAAWLALPESVRPVEQGLRVTYRLRWWQSFDTLLARLGDPAQQALWRGWRALNNGDLVAAQSHWQQAGAAGAALHQSLGEGQALLPELRAADRQTRDAAVARWEAWQAAQPGPVSWQAEDAAVRDFSGSASLYSVERDLYTQTYRLSEGRPLQLSLVGPTRVRVEVRPLHEAGRVAPLDGWIRVHSGKTLRLLPISNNFPAQGLTLVGDGSQVPGQREQLEFAVGPGMHQIEVEGGNMAALARVLTLRPERPLTVLPPLNADTAGAVLDGKWPATAAGKPCSWRDCLTVLAERGVAFRTAHADAQESPATRFAQDEASLARALADIPRSPAGGTSDDWPEAAALGRGDWEAALQFHPGATPQDAARRMLLLAWRAEQQPASRSRLLNEAEALAARYPETAEVQAMFARLSRDANWLPLPVAQSAGLRTQDIVGWQPESPALRIRKALLPAMSADEQVLSGGGRLLYDMQILRPATVRLHLTMVDVAGMVPVPLKAGYQLDKQPHRFVTLTPESPTQRVTLVIPPGAHSLRAWIESPLANQFLRIKIDDPRATPAQLAVARPYQVATVREPLRFSVAGPAWVRIDEWRDGIVRSHYRYIEAGVETVTQTPPAGRAEALYRVFQRIVGRDRVRSLPRYLDRVVTPVAAPLEAFDLRPTPTRATLQDGFPLGGQEDGTHSYQAGWHQRRDPDAVAGAAEKFLQLSATHRYFDENRRTYFKTTGLARLREQGGLTLGIEAQMQAQPTWTSLNFELDASLFAQAPGPASGIEWAALLAGKVSQLRHVDSKGYHIPYIRAFARALSLSYDSAYGAGHVDQDVFSRYKQQHLLGLELGDTYYRQPWLDSLWYLGANARTNPDFNLLQPDQMSLRTGWRQRLGKAQVGLEYRATRYLADDDRSQGYWRNGIDFELHFEHWLPSQNRSECGMRLSHVFNTGEQTGMLYCVWHASQGRRYRDFGPGEIDFRDIRERQAPLVRNNRIDGGMGVQDGR